MYVRGNNQDPVVSEEQPFEKACSIPLTTLINEETWMWDFDLKRVLACNSQCFHLRASRSIG